MVRIFNPKEDKSIFIEEGAKFVLTPFDYDEVNPHILIELKDFYFLAHAKKCDDCGAFLNALGTNSNDWYVEFLGKVKRLDLSNIGKNYFDNHLKFIVSEYEYGTRIKLNIDNDTIESLQKHLVNHLAIEDYEHCCTIRDKIKKIIKEELEFPI